jgi:hypothetical protein
MDSRNFFRRRQPLLLGVSRIGDIFKDRGAMLKTASTKIQTTNFITTAIRRNHFNHSHHSLSLSYTFIYAVPVPNSEKSFFSQV